MEEDLKCLNHSIPAAFYCKSVDCMYGICRDCGFYHLGHEKNLSINDSELPIKIKADINSYISDAQVLHTENQKVEENLNSMLEHVKNETQDLLLQIKSYFYKLHEEITQRELALISSAEDFSTSLQGVILGKIQECQEVSKNQVLRIEALSKFYDDLEDNSDKEIIGKSYQIFHKHPLIKPLLLTETYELDSKFSYDESLFDDISSTGKIFTYKNKLNEISRPNLYFFKEFSKNIYKYEIDSEEWTTLAKPCVPSFHNLSVVYVPDKNIYILIGNTGDKSMLIKFHPTYSNTEEETLSFEYPQWCGCIYYWESIYLIGGEVNDSSSSICRRYCPKSSIWHTLPSLIIPRDSVSALGFGVNLYVFGGYNNNCSLNSIEKYDKALEKWSLVKILMPMPLAFTGCINLGTHILLLGGEFNERNSNQVFKWDGCKKFEECPNLTEPFTSGSSDIIVYAAAKVFIIRADQEEYPRLEVINY